MSHFGAAKRHQKVQFLFFFWLFIICLTVYSCGGVLINMNAFFDCFVVFEYFLCLVICFYKKNELSWHVIINVLVF